MFFAALVSSLALAIGMAIYDLTVRELQVTSMTAQSQYAVFAADTGAECALYWDFHYNGTGSAFATSSASGNPTVGSVVCNGYNVYANGTPPAVYLPPTSSTWTSWIVTANANAATTTFYISFPENDRCVEVQIAKTAVPLTTIVYSHGFINCAGAAGGAPQLERELQVSY